MDERIKKAFDQVHATPELKERTAQQVLGAMERKTRPATPVWKPLCALAACLLLVLGLGGYGLYFTPTSVISVDINPSIELDVNILGRVIALHSYNDDGAALAGSLDVLHDSYQDAVDELLKSDPIVTCLGQGAYLSVSVVELRGTQGEEITQYVSHCTSGHHNVSCSTITSQEAQEAHHVGLSYGKYDIYLQIQAYDPTITPQQVSGMTMRELRELLASLQQENPDITPPDVDTTGNGNGNGAGNGNGNGSGGHHGNGNHP